MKEKEKEIDDMKSEVKELRNQLNDLASENKELKGTLQKKTAELDEAAKLLKRDENSQYFLKKYVSYYLLIDVFVY